MARNWTDSNSNFTPDCDLLNPLAQNLTAVGGDICGAWNNNTFGTEVFSTTYDPDMFKGWYTRPMDWQLGASVQRQILPRMSLEVGYHKRWIDKWTLVKNTLNSHADFNPYSVTAPADPRLGVASGRVIDDLWNISQAKFGQINNETILENNIPGVNRRNWWQGVDFNVNARLGGLTLRGGAVLSTRRRRLVHLHRERLLRHRHPRGAEPAQLQHRLADPEGVQGARQLHDSEGRGAGGGHVHQPPRPAEGGEHAVHGGRDRADAGPLPVGRRADDHGSTSSRPTRSSTRASARSICGSPSWCAGGACAPTSASTSTTR